LARRDYAAVMFTDIVGFTSLMEQSEEDALRILSHKMGIVRKLVTEAGGRIVKEMGDGTLSVFCRPIDAVSSAQYIQDSLCGENFRVRIGIHCGSVVFNGEDVFGDTVNVASRLEKKAPGGGILLSSEVLSCFETENTPRTSNLGLTRLKGLGRLLHIFFIGQDGILPEKVMEINPMQKSGPQVLAVFPLVNIGKPEDEFYAYGISADLLSDLAIVNSLSIVPATSLIGALKSGESQDSIAKRFGSTSIVQGTIERKNSQMELSLSLKEVHSGRTVWMDTWIENIDELPALKGKLADGILKALGKDPLRYPGIAEISVESASTYEKYLQALHLWETKKNRQHINQVKDLILQVIDAEPGMIPARVILGSIYRDSGDYAAGLEIFTEAKEIAQSGNNKAGILAAVRSIGISHWMKGDLDEAQSAYDEAMTLAKQLQNITEEASLLNNMGLIDCDRSLFAESLNKLEKSLELSKNLGLLSGQAHSLCNIGLVNWRSGNGAKAIEFYEKSLQIVTALNDQVGEANMLNNIGIIYNDCGDIELAYQTYSRSLELARGIDDKASICRVLNNMGSAMLALGQMEKAEEHFFDAIVQAKQLGMKSMEGILLTNFGILNLQRKEISSAKKHFLESLEISRDIDDNEGIVENNKYLAEIYLKRGNLTEALNLLNQALNLCEKFMLNRYIPSIRTNLALCLVERGAIAEEILQHIEKAKNTDTGNVKTLPDTYWKWSLIYSKVAKDSRLTPKETDFYLEEATKWKTAARKEILSAADRIQSEDLKQSFMNSIHLHRKILRSHTI
jgi:tetratricopeptide (TPR) repeat protein